MEQLYNDALPCLQAVGPWWSDADRRLLFTEYVVGGVLLAFFLALCAVAAFVEMEEWLRITLILIGLLPLVIAVPFMLRIEQTAGYYECRNCGHKYVPAYKNVFIAAHIHTTRYMKCPACGRCSWQKKVLRKE